MALPKYGARPTTKSSEPPPQVSEPAVPASGKKKAKVPDLSKAVEQRSRTAKARKERLNYHREYNQKNAEHLSALKSNRYQTDPEYRAAALERSRKAYSERKNRLKEIRRVVGPPPRTRATNAHKYCPTCHQALPRVPKPVFKSVGGRYLVAMYTISEVARRLGRQAKTVQLWLHTKVLPDTIYGDTRGRMTTMTRLWTQDQVELIMDVFGRYDLRPPVNFKKVGLVDALNKEWQALMPHGIDVSRYTVPSEHEGLYSRASYELPPPHYVKE